MKVVSLILVTGGTGLVGFQVVAELRRRDAKVRCLVRQTSNLEQLQTLGVELAYGDITQPSTLGESLRGVRAIVHLAAIIAEKGQATFERVNWRGTRNLVEAAGKVGVERFLYMSNIGASPDRLFPFLYSKWQAEEAVKASGLSYTIFRASVIFGPGDKFINTLADLIRSLPLVPVIGSGKTRFQPISVGEVARCLALALENDRITGQTLYLAGPERLSYQEILNIIMEVMGKKRPKLHIPIFMMRPLVWAMNRFMANPPLTTAQLAMLGQDNIAELDAVEQVFNFNPTSLKQGIEYVKASEVNLKPPRPHSLL